MNEHGNLSTFTHFDKKKPTYKVGNSINVFYVLLE